MFWLDPWSQRSAMESVKRHGSILISFSKFEILDYLMKKSGGYLDLRKSKRGFDLIRL